LNDSTLEYLQEQARYKEATRNLKVSRDNLKAILLQIFEEMTGERL